MATTSLSVGDRVKVRLSNINLSGRVKVSPGSNLTIPGKITRDQGDSWVIKLDIDVDGLDRIALYKTAQVDKFEARRA